MIAYSKGYRPHIISGGECDSQIEKDMKNCDYFIRTWFTVNFPTHRRLSILYTIQNNVR